jgi:ribonucleoside-diphosphate reductase alpha chain
MAATSQITPIDESEVALNEGSECSEPMRAVRRHLPDERRALTHHFSVGGQEGYLTVGVYDDGLPGEIFITMSKQGSTISGLMDSFATAVSLALQHGVSLEVLCTKFTHVRFEPSGWTGNPKIGFAKSIVDYIFRCRSLSLSPSSATHGIAYGMACSRRLSAKGAESARCDRHLCDLPVATPKYGCKAATCG